MTWDHTYICSGLYANSYQVIRNVLVIDRVDQSTPHHWMMLDWWWQWWFWNDDACPDVDKKKMTMTMLAVYVYTNVGKIDPIHLHHTSDVSDHKNKCMVEHPQRVVQLHRDTCWDDDDDDDGHCGHHTTVP